ncbi:hypothetical protein JCM19037_912 [Geomicrobium sp. JCM 19037]|uniref:hypothetical protein n=1 Tax=Geomicrobium sp. JCM 19037 TaxID=1460634 RepID=UPI00045F2736|nr:hypothetical protein [Geomicrobium sp. JCM 19037]GAK02662.1 hypothetical protein JCM19037_912 [Geomicrobium sp. JCM 19037]
MFIALITFTILASLFLTYAMIKRANKTLLYGLGLLTASPILLLTSAYMSGFVLSASLHETSTLIAGVPGQVIGFSLPFIAALFSAMSFILIGKGLFGTVINVRARRA